MILDTTFVIALRHDEDARAFARRQERSNVPRRIPATVVAELYVGVGHGDRPHENARAYEELVANLQVVPKTGDIARRAGAVAGRHAASDTLPAIGLADATIAATGLVYDEPVVTADVDDFRSVDGLDVVSW